MFPPVQQRHRTTDHAARAKVHETGAAGAPERRDSDTYPLSGLGLPFVKSVGFEVSMSLRVVEDG
jgi:hypothetical protein